MENTNVSDENRKIAKTILEVFGGNPRVLRYKDENNYSKIDILVSKDCPYELVTSYSTIGLSDYQINLSVKDIRLGVEFVGACSSEFEHFPNIISTCAFNIINSHFECYPGIIFKNIVGMYMPMSPMKHILFSTPFGWNKEFKTLEFPTKKVAWLLIVPISENEMQFSDKEGVDALESLFEEKNIDIYNLMRKSVL